MVDVSERLMVLLSQEAKIYQTSDYIRRMQITAALVDPINELGHSSPKKRKSPENQEESNEDERLNGEGASRTSSSSSQINEHWRQRLCKWAYQGEFRHISFGNLLYDDLSLNLSLILSVIDHFDLNREVVSIAMNHLDRYLSVYPTSVNKNLFQLLAMTCLFLSIKLNEYKHLILKDSKSTMESVLELSQGLFTLEQMEKMEFDILQRLQWFVHPPTPQAFVQHFLFLLPAEKTEASGLAEFMIELSVMDYFFVNFKSSEVAIAALSNALQYSSYPESIQQLQFILENHHFDSSNVQACRERLALIYAQASEPAESPKNVKVSGESRSPSPNSVMARLNASASRGRSYKTYDQMETEYSDDEDL